MFFEINKFRFSGKDYFKVDDSYNNPHRILDSTPGSEVQIREGGGKYVIQFACNGQDYYTDTLSKETQRKFRNFFNNCGSRTGIERIAHIFDVFSASQSYVEIYEVHNVANHVAGDGYMRTDIKGFVSDLAQKILKLHQPAQPAPSQPEPQVAPSQPEPQVAPSQPEPQVAPSQPEPQVAPSQPEPQVAPSQPEPQVAPSQPEPQAAPSQPQAPLQERSWVDYAKENRVKTGVAVVGVCVVAAIGIRAMWNWWLPKEEVASVKVKEESEDEGVSVRAAPPSPTLPSKGEPNISEKDTIALSRSLSWSSGDEEREIANSSERSENEKGELSQLEEIAPSSRPSSFGHQQGAPLHDLQLSEDERSPFVQEKERDLAHPLIRIADFSGDNPDIPEEDAIASLRSLSLSSGDEEGEIANSPEQSQNEESELLQVEEIKPPNEGEFIDAMQQWAGRVTVRDYETRRPNQRSRVLVQKPKSYNF